MDILRLNCSRYATDPSQLVLHDLFRDSFLMMPAFPLWEADRLTLKSLHEISLGGTRD
jgi:hypothetical protein